MEFKLNDKVIESRNQYGVTNYRTGNIKKINKTTVVVEFENGSKRTFYKNGEKYGHTQWGPYFNIKHATKEYVEEINSRIKEKSKKIIKSHLGDILKIYDYYLILECLKELESDN